MGLPHPTCGDLEELRARSEEGKAQMTHSWVGTNLTVGVGRGLMQERGPHTGPSVGGLGVPSPIHFLVRNGAWSTGNQDKSTTHSSGLDDSDSTSHSLLLCMFLNVCVPKHAPCQSVRLSALHTCAHIHAHG